MDGYSRFKPKDDGVFLSLTDRDLLWLEKIHRHGPLPSRHLYRYSKALRASDQKAQERLAHLTKREHTPHHGAYLYRPEQQRATDQALSNYMVHDIAAAGVQALIDAGRFRKNFPSHAHGRHWMHDFMLSCFTASIELAVLETPGYQYLFHDEICDKIGGQLDFKVEYEDERGKHQTRFLKPDRSFGIKYPDGTIRRFLVEADRGTEPNKPSEGRKSAVDNLLQYTEFIGEGRFRDAMHVTGGVVLIYLMTNAGKMRNMQEILKDMTGPCNYIAFKTVDGFGHVIKPPLPMPELFTASYERAGMPGLYLNK